MQQNAHSPLLRIEGADGESQRRWAAPASAEFLIRGMYQGDATIISSPETNTNLQPSSPEWKLVSILRCFLNCYVKV